MGLAHSTATALLLINVLGISSDGIFGMYTNKFNILSSQLTISSRYIADWVFALPTIAFFMCAIGIFIIGHFISSKVLGYRRFTGPAVWQKLIACIRYLSYRGFHVKALRWNSAPVGVLLLGLAGTTFFFCKLLLKAFWWTCC